MLVELLGPAEARLLADHLRERPPPGVVAAVPGQESLLVELDPLLPERRLARAIGHVRRRAARVAVLARSPDAVAPSRVREIGVCYGGSHGPDLVEVAALTGLPADEVVARHAGSELRVAFLGFAPGFAYIGELPPELSVSRLATPRTVTPPGSVAVAGRFTGIYPAELPGGWRIIGRTPISLFDPRRLPPAYLAPGDAVRFRPMPPDWFETAGAAPADW